MYLHGFSTGLWQNLRIRLRCSMLKRPLYHEPVCTAGSGREALMEASVSPALATYLPKRSECALQPLQEEDGNTVMTYACRLSLHPMQE